MLQQSNWVLISRSAMLIIPVTHLRQKRYLFIRTGERCTQTALHISCRDFFAIFIPHQSWCIYCR
jgi:hypothetical protein